MESPTRSATPNNSLLANGAVCSTPLSSKPSNCAQTIDFDFSEPCRYFKSSFARSLSRNQNQTTSLDFNINWDLAENNEHLLTSNSQHCTESAKDMMQAANRKSLAFEHLNDNSLSSSLSSPIAIPSSKPLGKQSLQLPSEDGINRLTGVTTTGHTGKANHNNCNRRNVWTSTSNPPQSASKQLSGLAEDTRLEIIGTMNAGHNLGGGRQHFAIPDHSTNVEAIVLQNQVDTLQWQLKQAETSCDMYRAVMKEVARFLERFQSNSDSMKAEISRSKSLHYVNNCEESHGRTLRARSNTNLNDFKTPSPISSKTRTHEKSSMNLSSYSAFQDFTWRRPPKATSPPKPSAAELDTNKLIQDAFRLSRTIHNLISTQQPDLTQYRNSVSEPETAPLDAESSKDKQRISACIKHSTPSRNDHITDPFSRIFIRKMNMRESRLSLRSSTDSSVHSTSSSSKTETDEENNYSPPPANKKLSAICSTTEDESGFSSISSFQEIGLPLSSTMISNSTVPMLNASVSSNEYEELNTEVCLDSRNSTLKASHVPPQPFAANSNTIGLPLIPNDCNRWDSLPATFKNRKFQRFSTLSNDDNSTVLWV